MEQVYPTTKRHKLMMCGVGFGSIGRPNEMHFCGGSRGGNFAKEMVLQPISLVGCVEPNVV